MALNFLLAGWEKLNDLKRIKHKKPESIRLLALVFLRERKSGAGRHTCSMFNYVMSFDFL
jgi:hypothetical protein